MDISGQFRLGSNAFACRVSQGSLEWSGGKSLSVNVSTIRKLHEMNGSLEYNFLVYTHSCNLKKESESRSWTDRPHVYMNRSHDRIHIQSGLRWGNDRSSVLFVTPSSPQSTHTQDVIVSFFPSSIRFRGFYLIQLVTAPTTKWLGESVVSLFFLQRISRTSITRRERTKKIEWKHCCSRSHSFFFLFRGGFLSVIDFFPSVECGD